MAAKKLAVIAVNGKRLVYTSVSAFRLNLHVKLATLRNSLESKLLAYRNTFNEHDHSDLWRRKIRTQNTSKWKNMKREPSAKCQMYKCQKTLVYFPDDMDCF